MNLLQGPNSSFHAAIQPKATRRFQIVGARASRRRASIDAECFQRRDNES